MPDCIQAWNELLPFWPVAFYQEFIISGGFILYLDALKLTSLTEQNWCLAVGFLHYEPWNTSICDISFLF